MNEQNKKIGNSELENQDPTDEKNKTYGIEGCALENGVTPPRHPSGTQK
jgi:hypothetical protein